MDDNIKQDNTNMDNNNKKDNVSVKSDVWYVAGAVGIFYVMLAIINSLNLSEAFYIMDTVSLLVKVSTVSLFVWLVKRFAFPNTLGKNFGDLFNSGWNNLGPAEKTRWTIVTFLVLFAAIASMT